MQKITLTFLLVTVITNILASDISTDEVLHSLEINNEDINEGMYGNGTDRETQKDDRYFLGGIRDHIQNKFRPAVNYRPTIDNLNSEISRLLQQISALASTNGANANLLPAALALCNSLTGTLTLTTLGAGKYYFSDTSLNWHAAQEFCNANGMELASLETTDKNNLIKAEIARRFPGAVDPTLLHWFGLNDLATSGTYIWTGLGTQTTIIDWALNSPTGNTEHCVGLIQTTVATNVQWDDANCDTKSARFICELLNPCLGLTTP